jgi:hypothetical protein
MEGSTMLIYRGKEFFTCKSFQQSELIHYQKIWICLIPEKELRCLSSDFRIHVSVSDLYSSPIVLKKNRQTDQGNI